jgi:hypothetical protein
MFSAQRFRRQMAERIADTFRDKFLKARVAGDPDPMLDVRASLQSIEQASDCQLAPPRPWCCRGR